MKIERLIDNLNSKGFVAHYCEDEKQANDLVLGLIEQG